MSKNSRADRSTKDFIHKLEIALKEALETRYWLKLIIDSELISSSRMKGVLKEIEEINNILAASIVKTKKKLE
ncbi:four helix bundle protein [Anaplasma marginale]|uniref:four helix bundle protein n=1 Tax=Anaplasma marginale TaxID=770 RepID=UPI0018E99952